VAGPSQFSAQQVMEAGRRAEADGNHDHAHQFFTHVLTHYPGSPEAAAASEATRRLADHHRVAHMEPVLVQNGGPGTGRAHGNANGLMPTPLGMARGPIVQPGLGHHGPTPQGFNPLNGAAAAGSTQRSASANLGRQVALPSDHRVTPAVGQRPNTAVVAVEAANQGTRGRRRVSARSDAAPLERQSTYPVGRALVRLLGFVAWLGIAVALAALGANMAALVSRPSSGAVLTMLAVSPWFAAALLFASIAVLLIAQMARAIFDTARSISAQGSAPVHDD
jgi:hypothetical protein